LGLTIKTQTISHLLINKKGIAGNKLPNYSSLPIITLNEKDETI